MKQQGATLIQMMWALALVALLTQLATTSYTSIRDQLQVASTAKALAQHLRYARQHAAMHGRSVQVRALQGNWSNGWQIRWGSDRKLLREHRLDTGLSIVSNGGGEIVFGALGIPLGPGGSFYGASLRLCGSVQATEGYRVVIATSGRINLRSLPQGEASCTGAGQSQ